MTLDNLYDHMKKLSPKCRENYQNIGINCLVWNRRNGIHMIKLNSLNYKFKFDPTIFVADTQLKS